MLIDITLGNAGGLLLSGITIGSMILLSGMVIMIVPVMVGYLFGHYVLKLNVALLLGALTGARTSTAALNILTEEAKSNVPALSYAGTYAFANVFMTLAGTVLVSLPL